MGKSHIHGKKILITGGAGFIGSNLCEYFIDQNEVICFDDLSTGDKANVSPLTNHANFTFRHADIRILEECTKAIKGVDLVFHQAALGSVPRSIHDPISTNQVNINGFLNMLVAAKEEGVSRFIYAASSSTYGDHPDLPKVEDQIGNPLSPYAVTKRANELYGKVFSDLYDMEIIGLRYFNVFGKNQSPDGPYAAAIPRFIDLLIRHESPVIHGDGEQSRDFTYINNVLHANECAALTEARHARGEVYNVAYGKQCTVNELVKKLIIELGKFDPAIGEVEVSYGPNRQGDVKHSVADISKAKAKLNYRPEYSLEKGIEEAIDWYWHSLSVSQHDN